MKPKKKTIVGWLSMLIAGVLVYSCEIMRQEYLNRAENPAPATTPPQEASGEDEISLNVDNSDYGVSESIQRALHPQHLRVANHLELKMKFLPLLGADLSGSLGGITASHNRGGAYFRTRTIPVNPNSSRQTTVRNALGSLVAAWTVDLTAAQRTSWETYASNVPVVDVLGQSRNLTGQQWYIKCNTPRLSAGKVRVDDAPVIFNSADLSPVSIGTIVPGAAGVATVEINYDDLDEWAVAVGGHLFVQIGQPQNQSVNFFKGPFQFADAENGAGLPPTSPFVVTSPFEIAVDQRIFARVRSSNDDARLSAAQIVDDIAV